MLLPALLLILLQAPQAAPRDEARPARQGSAVIRGRVTDADTGLPLPRVTVTLYVQSERRQIETRSDTDGAFEFTRVPAGEYSLTADPTRNRTTHLAGGYVVPGAQPPPGRRSMVTVRDGEVFEKADIALRRSYVISGRVFDEDGDPVADARVEAERVDVPGGGSTRSRTTDDRGAFRLWGFMPGSYRVCATPLSFSTDRQSTEGLIRTCHPSVLDNDAQPIVLANADSPEIEIRLRRSRLYRISGVILDASGAVAPRANLSFGTIERNGGSSSRSMQNDGGSFTFRGVSPGEYFLRAEVGSPFNADDRERQLGYTAVTVQAADVDNVVIAMVPPATVRGRLVFEGTEAPDPRSVTVRAFPETDGAAAQIGPLLSPAKVAPDYSFELKGLFGPQTLFVEGDRRWVIKSMRYRGEERANVPTEFRAGAESSALELVVTNRTAKLVVRVLDENGRQTDNARVALFPADPRQWGTANVARYGIPRQGLFEIEGVRAADYFVVALDATSPFSPRSRRVFEELTKQADRVTLVEGDQRAIDLPLRK